MYEVLALKFFLLPSKKNSIKNKVISININCSNCWPLPCSPLLKNAKKSAFWGEYDKGYYGNYDVLKKKKLSEMSFVGCSLFIFKMTA